MHFLSTAIHSYLIHSLFINLFIHTSQFISPFMIHTFIHKHIHLYPIHLLFILSFINLFIYTLTFHYSYSQLSTHVLILYQFMIHDVGYFPKGFFPSDNFPRVFSQVATSQLCNFPSGNFPSLLVP